MILKWLTPQGNWRLIDAVEDVTVHGRMTTEEVDKLVKIYDGQDGYITYMRDASAFGVEDLVDRNLYVMANVRGKRKHLVLHSLDLYILSDEGKTVDRIPA